MPQLSPERAKARSRIALLSKAESGATREQIEDARRDYAAATIEQFIEETLAKAPPLRPEQRVRLAALLAPRSAP